MKTIHEAVDIFEKNLNNALDLQNKNIIKKPVYVHRTREDGEPIPCPSGYWEPVISGSDDFCKIRLFKEKLDEHLNATELLTTGELITFAINFPVKCELLTYCILKSIREAAGFTDTHIDYLIPEYRENHSWRETLSLGHFGYIEVSDCHTKYVCKIAIENSIARKICYPEIMAKPYLKN